MTVAFPLLADPNAYVACVWDLTSDPTRRRYWLDLFRGHFPSLLEHALTDSDDRGIPRKDSEARAAGAAGAFYEFLDAVRVEPGRYGRLDILSICDARERSLRRFAFDDPYRLVKRRETEAALSLLPTVLASLSRLPPDKRWLPLAEGVFAGNLFDLGATDVLDKLRDGAMDFLASRGELAPRPWLVDDLDAWIVRITSVPRHRAAVLFVDNAGCDIVLGMLPLARELLSRGTEVILAANETPALNDVTYSELVVLMERVRAVDPIYAAALADGRLEIVSSGGAAPLIDLTKTSEALARAVARRGADLVVLEGMGRALESNYDARFRCDTLKLAMVKDRDVAHWLGGKNQDLVMRFDRASS